MFLQWLTSCINPQKIRTFASHQSHNKASVSQSHGALKSGAHANGSSEITTCKTNHFHKYQCLAAYGQQEWSKGSDTVHSSALCIAATRTHLWRSFPPKLRGRNTPFPLFTVTHCFRRNTLLYAGPIPVLPQRRRDAQWPLKYPKRSQTKTSNNRVWCTECQTGRQHASIKAEIAGNIIQQRKTHINELDVRKKRLPVHFDNIARARGRGVDVLRNTYSSLTAVVYNKFSAFALYIKSYFWIVYS